MKLRSHFVALSEIKQIERQNWLHNETYYKYDTYYCKVVGNTQVADDCPSEYPYAGAIFHTFPYIFLF